MTAAIAVGDDASAERLWRTVKYDGMCLYNSPQREAHNEKGGKSRPPGQMQ